MPLPETEAGPDNKSPIGKGTPPIRCFLGIAD